MYTQYAIYTVMYLDYTCIIPLGSWSNMCCRSSARSGLLGLASMAASSACAVKSSFETVMFFTLSPPLGAGEGERDIEACCCWPSEPEWCDSKAGTSSEDGLPDSDVSEEMLESTAIAAVVVALVVSGAEVSERLSLWL